MEDNSKVIVSGIVTDINLNSDIVGIIRPVAEITVYNEQKKEWVNHIYVIFSDNSSARQFKAFRVGAIVLVTGELVYYPGVGYAIYARSYIILEKNKEDCPINIQKVFLFDNIGAQNFVYIKGDIIYINQHTVSISHTILQNIRGDLIKQSVQPLYITNSIREHTQKAIFTGSFTSGLIEGEMYEIA